MTIYNGQCMCGAVKVSATPASETMTACHCDSCRRLNSGPNYAFEPVRETLDIRGDIQIHKSSDWAERGFCPKCGSGVFYRVTAEGPHMGTVKLSAGLFENAANLTVATEFFIDKKPEGYPASGGDTQLSEAEVFALFSAANNGEKT